MSNLAFLHMWAYNLRPKEESDMSKLITIIQSYFVKNNDDFAAKVLVRYSTQKSVSAFSRELFQKENAETINARFEQTKIRISR